MATPDRLIGLGLPVFHANELGVKLSNPIAGGSSAGSATQLAGPQSLSFVNATNGGAGLLAPVLNGDVNGAQLTDVCIVMNLLSASLILYAANNPQGSAVTFLVNGVSTLGTTGISVTAGFSLTIAAISPSTWVSA